MGQFSRGSLTKIVDATRAVLGQPRNGAGISIPSRRQTTSTGVHADIPFNSGSGIGAGLSATCNVPDWNGSAWVTGSRDQLIWNSGYTSAIGVNKFGWATWRQGAWHVKTADC